MFQDMAPVKPPRLGREKPWHQDHAHFDYPLGTPVVGGCIALDEATIENGCMHLLPGPHMEGPIPHFKRRDWPRTAAWICGTPIRFNRSRGKIHRAAETGCKKTPLRKLVS